ncbi:GCN5 family acetyltransferase [Methanosarcina sp. 1.H.T.1A.1]|uniref:GNAT family N-acetyltransferase n=1 Tax=unclassified Methanosarcina TaxID=2644672 RepID=UPI00062220D5|nr:MULTISPECIES: GNAT family N-acetyltransferase [unclassified Methanosarcina]KKH49765.1 GCN5 family acetyltransferase [Methanosarcina sp. 1.H.A.2.2]KKH95997.1 GCN5 family acetyltransferase [Methanosarcina sp. 1.H.T.1A.1]
MDPTQIYMRLVSYFASFLKLLRDTIGAHLLKEWKHTEKEHILPVDETMLPEILRIQAEGFDSKKQENLIKYSKKFRKIFYVIKNQDKIAGYCIYYLKPELSFKGLKKKSVVYSIAIDKKFRGKGYGRTLLEESIKEMRLNGIYSILLYVNVKNTPAIKLYEKMDFQIIKKIEGICGQNETCYIMELKLA